MDVELDGANTEARHRRERKELQNTVTGLRKSIPKGDKKKKKDVTAQIEALEHALEQRHAAENADEADARVPEAAAIAATADAGEGSTEREDAVSIDLSADDGGAHAMGVDDPKKSKAQKRRDKKEAEDRLRDEAIRNGEIAKGESRREMEYARLVEILAPLELTIKPIKPDGHCLFSSVLYQVPTAACSVREFRQRVAAFMAGHAEDYQFYLTNAQGDVFSEAEYMAYCATMASAATWGGQCERTIETFQAGTRMQAIGRQHGGDPIRISYHLHEFGLGAHYNAVVPKGHQPVAVAEDDSWSTLQ